MALAVGQQCAQAGKDTVLHRKVCTGNPALYGAAGREHCGMLLCVEKLEKTRSYMLDVCEVLVNVHHPKPRKNVPYP